MSEENQSGSETEYGDDDLLSVAAVVGLRFVKRLISKGARHINLDDEEADTEVGEQDESVEAEREGEPTSNATFSTSQEEEASDDEDLDAGESIDRHDPGTLVDGFPSQLVNYPSMMPHVGHNYGIDGTLIIGESPYLPRGSDLDNWYQRTETSLSEEERSYIDLSKNIAEKSAKTYERIEEVVPFSDITFCNYFQRPAETGRTIGGTVTEEDIKVADSALRWFLDAVRPEKVIVASRLAGEHAASVLDEYGISHIVTDHPMRRFAKSDFRERVTAFLQE